MAKRASALFLVQVLGLTAPAVSVAVTIVIGDRTPPRVELRVGSSNRIDEVRFSLPADAVGTGLVVAGSQSIRIRAVARARPANSRQAVLSVDSSTPLSNGSDTIPMTQIRWVASDGDIPSGAFTGADQVLATFFNSRRVTTTHNFEYINTVIPGAGEYTGQVTYTLSMP